MELSSCGKFGVLTKQMPFQIPRAYLNDAAFLKMKLRTIASFVDQRKAS
jgi:hypothetical protein